jgi:hypothetical protein
MSNRSGFKKKEIYFTDEDWAAIDKRAKDANMNTTKFIRSIAVNGEFTYIDFKDAHEIQFELHKVGVNINQIAKKVNETNHVYKVDIEMIKKGYDDICRMLNQFLSGLQSTKL